jgi:hypothetical protein
LAGASFLSSARSVPDNKQAKTRTVNLLIGILLRKMHSPPVVKRNLETIAFAT